VKQNRRIKTPTKQIECKYSENRSELGNPYNARTESTSPFSILVFSVQAFSKISKSAIFCFCKKEDTRELHWLNVNFSKYKQASSNIAYPPISIYSSTQTAQLMLIASIEITSITHLPHNEPLLCVHSLIN
jgi:hypothetical protein